MKRLGILAAAIALGIPQVGHAIALEDIPAPVVMPQLPPDAKAQPVGLARLIMSIPQGYVWGTPQIRFASGCLHDRRLPEGLVWRGTSGDLPKKQYGFIFAQELKAAGFVAADDPDSPFQENRGRSDLEVGGSIKDMQASVCIRVVDHASDRSPDPDKLTGGIEFTIDWQLYSRGQKKIVYEQQVKSGFMVAKHEPGNFARMIDGGIRENIRALIASEGFRKVVLAAPELNGLQTADKLPSLSLPGALQARPMKMGDAVGSVVLIQSGGGHGSGFLISSDGYLMTAQHVVGSDKYVKIRWSDGLEGVGEMVRSDKRRDVALIKVDPRGRQPLALHRQAPQPGDTVFAIGAPLDPKLQNTVTRGVASANRIMDGFAFIQSDVTINPGNSGGPLLDEKGAVLGIADLTLREREDAPTGLNFFVPIRDALDFLALEPR